MKFSKLNEKLMKIKVKIFVKITFSEWILFNKQRTWVLIKNNDKINEIKNFKMIRWW